MGEFILFSFPTLLYLLVLTRRREHTVREAARRAGMTIGSPADYGWALLLAVPLLLAGWLAIVLIPRDVLSLPGVQIAQLTSAGAVAGVVLRAAGEEILFRGLLGGVLVRRLGFARGNAVQSLLFLVPHLPLLAVDPRMLPILPVQFAVGWLLGWLRERTGTLLPGAAVHALSNLAAGLLA
ncbi:CPBP family intramembrane glutamic endopeptidase [Brachybacterium hainanense]|uniref:Lysostaphin resistance A-like protein n=1 Tax=Brachybacterium hainanense TaxID=1541174 RepID=A0ABV6R932_9MICO